MDMWNIVWYRSCSFVGDITFGASVIFLFLVTIPLIIAFIRGPGAPVGIERRAPMLFLGSIGHGESS